MSDSSRPYDVFLSHAAPDREAADSIARAITDSGLSVFLAADSMPAGSPIAEYIRDAIESVSAFVLVYSANASRSSWVQIELGAAWGWGLPIFAIWASEPSEGKPQVSGFLSHRRIYSPQQLGEMIESVHESVSEISEEDLAVLRDLYLQLNIPTDQLTRSLSNANRLALEFQAKTGRTVKPERLVRLLVRDRKRGTLPRLRDPI